MKHDRLTPFASSEWTVHTRQEKFKLSVTIPATHLGSISFEKENSSNIIFAASFFECKFYTKLFFNFYYIISTNKGSRASREGIRDETKYRDVVQKAFDND